MQLNTDLSKYDISWFKNDRPVLRLVLWHIFSVLFFLNYFSTSSSLKVVILRMFGARIGKGVIIKQGVRIKFPWQLEIGNHVWLGELCWIENQAKVTIGNNVCLSQGATLLTGNHDYKKSSFDLVIGEVKLENGVWIGARSMVCPGVTCKSHAVLSVESVASKDLEAWTIYRGNPATKQKEREILS